MFAKGELKSLWKIYTVFFFEHIFGLAPLIWIVYFNAKGFSFAEISIGMAVFGFSALIFEIPTGAVADVFGRRISVFLCYFVVGILSFLAPFVKTFWQLCLLYLVWGLALTLASGAFEAWIVDNLKQEKKEHLLTEYYSKQITFSQGGIILSGILLTLLLILFSDGKLFLSYDKIWFVQAIGMIVVSFIVLSTPEHFEPSKTSPKQKMLDTVKVTKNSFKYIISNYELFLLCISVAFGAMAGVLFSMAYQPFLVNVGFSLEDFGWTRSIAAIIGILFGLLGGYLARKIKKWHHLIPILLLLEFIAAFLVVFAMGKLFGLLFFVFIWNMPFLSMPAMGPLIQEHIPSKERATIGSIRQMIGGVAGGILLLFTGVLVDKLGPHLTIFISGFFYIPLIWIFWRVRRKEKIIQKEET